MAKFFDALVWLLIVFPFLSGGVWIKRPGLWIELSELAVPTLIVVFFAWILRRKFRFSLEHLSSIRFLRYLWNTWFRSIRTNPIKTLVLGSTLVGLLWFLVSYFRHYTFHSHAVDLGIFTSAMWNLTHGNGYLSSLKEGINLFGDHQSPIFYFVYPFFKIYPHPATLFILQSFILAFGAIPLYFLARRTFKNMGHYFEKVAAAFPLLYWSYSPIRSANRFDFHPEVWFLPAALAAVWGLQSVRLKERWIGFLFFLIALAAKESSTIVLTALCMAWMVGFGEKETRYFTRKLGLVLLPVCVGVCYFDMVLVPKFLNLQYFYQSFYSYLGSSSIEVVLSPILNPVAFWGKLFERSSFKFIFWILGPMMFLPLLNWRAWILLIPTSLMFIISRGDLRIQPIYHHGIEPAFTALVSFPGAILLVNEYFRRRSRIVVWRRALPAVWLFFVLISFGRSEVFYLRQYESNPHTQWLHTKMIPCIAPNVSLTASGALVPHLIQRGWIHHLPNLDIPSSVEFLASSGTVQNQTQVSCVVFDADVNNWPLGLESWAGFFTELDKRSYSQVYSCGNLKVFQWSHSQESCMTCSPVCN